MRECKGELVPKKTGYDSPRGVVSRVQALLSSGDDHFIMKGRGREGTGIFLEMNSLTFLKINYLALLVAEYKSFYLVPRCPPMLS